MPPVTSSYDPYNSPIDDGREDVCEPRVLLFPLSYSANALESSSLSREIRVSAAQPLHNFPRNSMLTTVEPSSNAEIEELKRRLNQIKRRRARQRERTLELTQGDEDEELERIMKRFPPIPDTPPPPPPPQQQPESPVVSNPNHELPSKQPASRRRPSVSSQTAGETIDTSLESSANNASLLSLHPRRFFCSTYKAKNEAAAAAASRKEKRSRTTRPAISAPPDEGEVSTNLLDSLVCLRSNEDDRGLDLIFCSEREREENTVNSYRQAREEGFDPYQSRGAFMRQGETEKRWEETVPRGRACSVVVGEEESLSTYQDVAITKSCLPQRAPAWYERPDAIRTDSSDNVNARVMEMVFYSNHPSGQFDTRHRLQGARFADSST